MIESCGLRIKLLKSSSCDDIVDVIQIDESNESVAQNLYYDNDECTDVNEDFSQIDVNDSYSEIESNRLWEVFSLPS